MKGRVADNIETLKRYAQWLDANNREREDGPSEEANAILNLISVVGTLEARNKELTRLVSNAEAVLRSLAERQVNIDVTNVYWLAKQTGEGVYNSHGCGCVDSDYISECCGHRFGQGGVSG